MKKFLGVPPPPFLNYTKIIQKLYEIIQKLYKIYTKFIQKLYEIIQKLYKNYAKFKNLYKFKYI